MYMMTSLQNYEVIFTQPAGYNVGESAERVEAPVIDAENILVQGVSYVTAAGLVYADATQLTTYYSFITVPVATNGVILPEVTEPNIGQSIMLVNLSANAATVYPYGVETVAGGATYVLAAGASVILLNDTISTWVLLNYAGSGIIIGANCNTFLGNNAGNTTLTGTDNTGIGCDVMPGVTTAIGLTGVGSHALGSAVDGQYMVAMGYYALNGATNSVGDIGIGYQALLVSDGGGESDLAIGYQALAASTAPTGNIAIGYTSQVLNDPTIGRNVTIGYETMILATNSSRNVAIGYQAMRDADTVLDCVFVGHVAGQINVADEITGIGQGALNNNTTGARNCAIGWGTLEANVIGNDNAAGGWNALNNSTGDFNTAFGSNAGGSFTTSSSGSFFGYTAGSQSTGNFNTGIGYSAIRQTSGTYNAACGYNAMGGTFVSTASRCVAVGGLALSGTTGTGNDNVCVGYNTCAVLSIGVGELTAIGTEVLAANTTGTGSVGVGWHALTANTTGTNNSIVGYGALDTAQDATDTTAVGYQSFTALGNGTSQNTALGASTGVAMTSGNTNTFLGYNAGSAVTTANNSIYINNVGVDTDAGIVRIGTAGTQVKSFQAGIRGIVTDVADAVTVLIDSAGQLGTVSSSERYKENIRDMTPDDTSFIHKLRPVEYQWKDKTKDQREQPGFIAEEVAEVAPFYISRDANGLIDTVKYHELITPLIAEVQRLTIKVDQLQEKIANM